MTAPTAASQAVHTGAAPAPVLRCEDLRKTYGDLVAVDGLSFEIAPGETYGLLGPNGAGKTTAISIVAGILVSDAGEVVINGTPMTTRSVAVKADVGYVPQEIAIYPDLSGRENLRFFAGLYGLRGRAAAKRIEAVLDAVGLSDRAGGLVRTYSGGMQRRLNIGIGLLHEPRLLILDEPTVGVDPQSRNAILASVEKLSAQGLAVLYTTHYMEEAERLCDRVGIVDLGRLIAEGTPRQLTSMVGEYDRIRLSAGGNLTGAATALRPLVRAATPGPDGIDVLCEDAHTALPEVLATAATAGATVRAVTVDEPDLEAVFLHLTGKTLRD